MYCANTAAARASCCRTYSGRPLKARHAPYTSQSTKPVDSSKSSRQCGRGCPLPVRTLYPKGYTNRISHVLHGHRAVLDGTVRSLSCDTVQCGTGPPLPWRSAERCCAVPRQRCCSHRICTLSGYSGRYIDRSAKSTVTIKVHLNLKWPSRRLIMIVHDEASRTRRHALCTRGDDDRA
jgi:hypothetical protein